MLCKNIVVVTCEKHWAQCRALLDSINFWLSGFNVVVVDNTPEPINLKYNMSNNSLRIMSWSDFIPNRVIHAPTYDNGWISQQLIKLQAHTLFDDCYVVLDSTALILKPIVEWPRDLCPFYPKKNHSFYKFYKSAYRQLGFKKAQSVVHAQSPVVFECAQVKALLGFWSDWKSFEEWFCSFQFPSEFWLYDLWLRKQGSKHHTKDCIDTTLLVMYSWNCWQQYQKNPRWGYYSVATIKQPLWEDKRLVRDNIMCLNRG